MDKIKIDYLLFDLGNVFVYWDKRLFLNAFIEGLKDKNHYTLEYSDPYWLDLITYESYLETGQFNWIQFCKAIESKYGWKGCPDSLLRSFQDIFEPNGKLIDWFLSTKFDAYLILMSNTNFYHWQWISKYYEFLLNKFDHLHLSHKIGFRKPLKEYYLNSSIPLKWNRTIYVDDLIENLKVPKELGAFTHHFEDNEGLWCYLNGYTF